MGAKEVTKRKRIGAFATMTYPAYVRQLKTLCKKRKFLLHELGRADTRKSMPLYALILNPKARGKTVCVCAGIHGSEESGSLAVLKFLEQVRPRLFSRTKVIIFPCANPTGFDVHKRVNYNGYDLNRRFIGRRIPEENRLMLEALQKDISAKRLAFFLSLHEDDARAVYFHVYGRRRERVYGTLLSAQSRFFPILATLRRYTYKLDRGLSFDVHDKSFDDRLNRDGVPYCISVEIPTLYPISRMMKAQVSLINTVVRFVADGATPR